MIVTVSHVDEMRFIAKGANSSFVIDAPVISPVEIFLSGLIACSATDMIAIPKNQGKTVRNLAISGDVERNEEMPRKFNTLHLTYTFDADDVDETTAARWVMGSIETYCSTINTVRDNVKISYSIVFNGKPIRSNETIISGGAQGGNTNIDFGEIESCPA